MSERREVVVDTRLGELYYAEEKAHVEIAHARERVARMVGIKGEYVRRRLTIRQTDAEIREIASAKLAGGEERWYVGGWYGRDDVEQALAKWDEAKAKVVALRAEAEPLDAEYRAKQWSRFFLVQNHGGHIHSSMRCSTCFPTTRFAWLPTLSGLTEKDAVEEHGPLLCSVCFPSAPVEWTVGVQRDVSDRCPGSGTWDHDSSGLRYMSPRARCNHCRVIVSVTSTGKLRAHKKAATDEGGGT